MLQSPTQNLPAEFTLQREINLQKDKKALLWLNIGAIILLFPVAWLLSAFIHAVRPGTIPTGFIFHLNNESITTLIVILTGIFFVLILHEAVHGLFFWVFTKSRPVFALRLTYAYAAAPDWFIPALQYVVIGLSPLVLLDMAGLLFIWLCPPTWIIPASTAIIMNTCGAVGDMFIIGSLLISPSRTLVQDSGDSVRYFSPALHN